MFSDILKKSRDEVDRSSLVKKRNHNSKGGENRWQ